MSNYEKSEKPAHRKFVRFVELTLESEVNNESTAKVMTPKAKMTAAKSKPKAAYSSKIEENASNASWTQVDQVDPVDSETDMQFSMEHLEEEICFMKVESTQVTARLAGLEQAMQEVISHLKQFQVKTEP